MALSLVLAACGGSGSSSDSNENASPEENGSVVDFPTKNVEIIVPYAAGGGTDVLARSFADIAEDELGQSISVVNREGGGGAVGMQTGAAATPDGHTVTMVTVELLTLPHADLAQFTYEDFTPVALLNEDPAAVTVRADAPWDTIEEFIAHAQENPGLQIGNSGTGAIWHLAAAGFEQAIDASFNHIPFDGAAPAVTALLGGHIDAVSVSPAEVQAQVEAGELKVLAVMAEEEIDSLPGVPTLLDAGYDVAIGTWRGLAVPSETPEEEVAVLEQAFAEAAQDQAFIDVLNEMNLGYRYEDGSGFRSLMSSQDQLFGELIPTLDIN